MKTKFRRSQIILVVLTILAIGLPAALLAPSEPEAQSKEIRHYLAQHYELGDLKGNSTAIVLGSVVRFVASSGSVEQKLVHSVFEFETSRYIMGSGPSFLFVSDEGGQLDGVSYSREGSPLLRVGASYLLFLSNDWRCDRSLLCVPPPTPLDTTYFIVGGVQGKFLVEGDRVFGFKTLYPNENYYLGVDANGTPLEDFVVRVLEE